MRMHLSSLMNSGEGKDATINGIMGCRQYNSGGQAGHSSGRKVHHRQIVPLSGPFPSFLTADHLDSYTLVLKLLLMNPRSMNNKIYFIWNFILDEDAYHAYIMETWLD